MNWCWPSEKVNEKEGKGRENEEEEEKVEDEHQVGKRRRKVSRRMRR